MTSKASYTVSGMSCNSCVAKVQTAIKEQAGISTASVSLVPPKAEITYDQDADLDQLNNILSGNGYLLSPIDQNDAASTNESVATGEPESFKPLIIIIGYLILAVLITQYLGGWDWRQARRIFMGGFFLVFSFFKMLDLRGFALSYSMYDIVAKRWQGWAYIYPFVELGLGISYLINYNPFVTNVITLLVMGVSSIGVVQAVINKRKIKCACLGTGFNLPMTTVTIIEDLTMVGMAAFMLLA